MKTRNLLYWTLAIALMCSGGVKGQNSKYPWAVGFGYAATDFYGPNKGGIFNNSYWNPGVRLQMVKSIAKSWAIAPSLYLGDVYKTPYKGYFAGDLALQYKFANGYLLKENSMIDPYLSGGLGFSYLNESTRGLFQAGAGVSIWVMENLALDFQTHYQNLPGDLLNDNYYLHTIGLKWRWGDSDRDEDGIADKYDACPYVKGKKDLQGCPDTDADGIVDQNDACPLDSGLVAFQGCPDRDGDGIKDKEDECPKIFGIAAFKGCPDTDGDGIKDAEDACPTVNGTVALKGCPDKDNDSITDAEDQCPDIAGLTALKGCPDKDGDGITDALDRCPDSVGTEANRGCPPMKVSKTIVEKKLNMSAQRIQFETGSDAIKPSSFGELRTLAKLMQSYPNADFVIEGHTDNQGNAANNLDLSQRRADAIKNYLKNQGVEDLRLVALGYGDQRPIASNKTPKGKALNRRVEIHLK